MTRRSPRTDLSDQVIVSSFGAIAEEHRLISHLAGKLGLNRSMTIIKAVEHYAQAIGESNATLSK